MFSTFRVRLKVGFARSLTCMKNEGFPNEIIRMYNK